MGKNLEKLKEAQTFFLLSNKCYTHGTFPKAKDNLDKGILILNEVIEDESKSETDRNKGKD